MSASTALSSNAFNFQSYVQHGVDPRTGQYTVALSVPELHSHALAGPAFPLTIGFSPMNTRDAGFGLGWGINLTEYDPRTRILSLGTGETFKVTGSGELPGIAEKKLDSFHFHDDGNERYRVVHRSGLVEVLRVMGGSTPLALPEQVLGADGRALSLTYVPFGGGQRLATISDPNGELLRVDRNEVSDQVALLYLPDQGENGEPWARFLLQLDGQARVTRVVLPTDEDACWSLAYDEVLGFSCLHEIWTPAGAHETVRYTDAGHTFPGEAHTPLPRVTVHQVDPGAGQPPIEVQYAYTHENFLGYGALSDWRDDGLDNLYHVADPAFRYASFASLMVGGSKVREVKRYYNRFHLMTEEITIQGVCQKRTLTTYYADLPENRQRPFAQQPPQCQLPHSVETFWELTNDATRQRVETSGTRFDDHGNLIEQLNADGTRETLAYFPAEGDGTSCPPDPEGFVRNLRSRTVHPAAAAQGDAPTLRNMFTYVALPPIPGEHSHPYLAEHSQTSSVVGGSELQRTQTEYFNDPEDIITHGRKRSISEVLQDHASFTDYRYALGGAARLGEDALEITETLTGFDGTTQTVAQQHSVRNGKMLRVQGLDGVEVLCVYDALGRPTAETIAPDTEFVATRRYAYHLVGERGGDAAWQITTDVKGVQTRTHFDGLSRAVKEECQDADAALAAGHPVQRAAFRPTYEARYNALDQRETATEFDWLDGEDHALTTRHAYDAWGECRLTTHPDGVREVVETSPFGPDGPVVQRWLENNAGAATKFSHRITRFNRFGKADTEEQLDEHGTVLHTLRQLYDGLGQCVETREQFGSHDLPTQYTYDAWRRMDTTVLADGTTLSRRFAPHSDEDLPVEMRVKPANATLPEVVIGEQSFDGLSRTLMRRVGNRTDTFGYTGGQMQPATRTTAAQRTIAFDYATALGDAPRTVTAPDDAATYRYDPLSGTLLGADNRQGERSYTYTYTGQVHTERWKTGNGDEHVSHYTGSRLGRPIRRHDSGPAGARYGLTTTCHYDDHGRLSDTEQGVLRAEVAYDALGRPSRTTTRNTLDGKTLVNDQTYDSIGRETQRVLTVGSEVFTVTQAWRGDDRLERRHLQRGSATLLDEAFHYDRRGRLQRHVCEGDHLPQDTYGNAIAQQVFTYDALDNITRCISQFADGTQDIADHTYAGDDPCQLTQVAHRHPDYPATVQFTYDDDGNLTRDHQGNQLQYDSLGRLLSLGNTGGQTQYHYDGHGELTGRVDPDGRQTLQFYDGYQLHHQLDGVALGYVLHAAEQPVGYVASGGGEAGRLLLTTAIGSVIGETRQDQVATTAYAAYGEAGAELAALLGFNGEPQGAHGWYLLGRGYRAYHPALKRFNRPDAMVPFDGGGMNPYVYCEGDPTNFRDPSGHLREVPDYYYPPPPPPPVKQPSGGGGGGGWLKWLGVAISGVFLAVSLVAAPWSLGMTAPLMIASLKGAAIQVAAIGLQVMGNLSSDPTLQMVGMIGGMVLGMYGGMAMGKANAAAATLIKQQKLTPTSMPVFKSGLKPNVGIPRAKLGNGPATTGPTATPSPRGATGTTGTPSGPGRVQGPAQSPNLHNADVSIPRIRVPKPLVIRHYADAFSGKNPGQSTFWQRQTTRHSPLLAGYTSYR